MTEHETVLILDFGGQYNQLIARRVREAGVYCELVPFDTDIEKIRRSQPRAVIFTGGPASVTDEGSPRCDPEVFELGVPVLGICYGAQLMAWHFGGGAAAFETREYGRQAVTHKDSQLFAGTPASFEAWMSHTINVTSLPEGFEATASTPTCPIAALESRSRRLYGVQFHPEVTHTSCGREILENFLFGICGLKGDWSMKSFIEQKVAWIQETVGDGKVLCALSGGVDSSVAAAIVNRAIGSNLTCVFVDHGFLRKDEADQVERDFARAFGLNFIRVDAADRFFSKMSGVSDPERKRKIIGEEFIRVFEDEADKLEGFAWLLQGTIYPDVIESGTRTAATIKSHHNVGGLPEDIDFTLLEPLRELFKDEVRALGRELGLPEALVGRQPFPGPGLAIRVIGEITPEKLATLREADAIFREELESSGLAAGIWQYFAVLPSVLTVGVMGDERTYAHTVALRAVTSDDAMTADWARIDLETLARVSNRIVNEVRGVNRVVYDITSKPPSTIEWE